jgi:acetylornithine/succinyldiaminopimelate/putrescine aminotransferase
MCIRLGRPIENRLTKQSIYVKFLAAREGAEMPLRRFSTREEVNAAFAAHVNPGKVRTFSALGLELIMGERRGARFADAFSGRRYFNCHSNGGVFNLGHRSPPVVAAVREALDELDIGNHHLVSPMRAALAERLAATTGGRLPGVVFAVSGGEATDLAIQVVRARTGRTKIVSVHGGYHGHTGLARAAGDPSFREPFGPNLPGFEQVPFDDLEAMDRAVDGATAAVLLEGIPATLGMALPSPGYLAGVQEICRRRGARLILDEVQTGLGRTGTFWFYEQEGIVPDALTTGKGLGGGIYPIAATLMNAELHAFFDEHPFLHISTFGGAELGCAAALAVLDVVQAPGFLARVRALGERFAGGLSGMPFELRQRGLFMGLKFPAPDGGFTAMRRLLAAGVFALFAGHDPSVLQLLPPLTLEDGEADEILAILREVLR